MLTCVHDAVDCSLKRNCSEPLIETAYKQGGIGRGKKAHKT